MSSKSSVPGNMGPPPIPWKTRPTVSSLKDALKDGLKDKMGLLHGRHHQDSSASAGSASEQRYHATAPIKMYVNGAYYPNWAVYQQGPPSSLSLRCLSHVFYAFAHVKEDGTVFLSDPWADIQMEVDGTHGCLRSFANLRNEHRHLKVILSVGGGARSQNFAAVADNRTYRETFGQTCLQLVTEYGLDGIDIDWEHPSDNRQGRNYILLLQTVRHYLPPPYILTSALPAGEWALRHIDLFKASRYLDLINIMAYDFSGPWTAKTGHQAQLFAPKNPHDEAAAASGDGAVNYILNLNVPAHKLVLGVPIYGRSFLGANNIGQSYHKPVTTSESEGPGNVFLYKDLPRSGASPEYVDREVVAAWSHGGDGGFVTYDNPETVRIKAGYVKQRSLGGIFFWTGPADCKSGERSLVEASYMELHSSF